jgi:hypothetical protein
VVLLPKVLAGRLKGFLRELALFFKGLNQAILEESVEALEAEYVELEYAFLTILFGSFIGVKTIPLFTSLEILEAVRDEVLILESRGYRGEDVLADLVSSLGGEW